MDDDPGVDEWASLAGRFVDDHYGSLRGRVRTHVVGEHLRSHLGPRPQRIVDVGGGAGTQSLPLARAGHEVTIVDPSAAMLDRASAAVADEAGGTRGRVHLVHADGEEAPRVLGGAVFDAVLCHGVLMYLDDPDPLVAALCELTAPGGVLSIVAKNVRTMAVLPALAGDWATAIEAFDAVRQINGLGVDTRGDDVDVLSALIAERGVEPVTWYGVRLFTDGWLGEGAPPPTREDLALEAELMASRRDPYRQLSRLFHLVGRRPPTT